MPEEMVELKVFRLVPEAIQISKERLEEINKTASAYTAESGDACFILRATQLGLAPGHVFLMWGV